MTDQQLPDLNPSEAVTGLDPQDALVAEPKPSTDVAHDEGPNRGDPEVEPDPEAEPVADEALDLDDVDLDGVGGVA